MKGSISKSALTVPSPLQTFKSLIDQIQTLLYMLIQRAGTGTLPPPGFHTPDWTALSEQWGRIPAASPTQATLGPATLTLGQDDSEAEDQDPLLNGIDDVLNRTYGWDNESPARVVQVEAFKAEWRPITNNEYMAFWRSSADKDMPKSWIEEDGEIKV